VEKKGKKEEETGDVEPATGNAENE